MSQVIINIHKESIEVDEHCAEMVLFLNQIGMKTKMCCQGHEKDIYRIWFDVSDEQMAAFISKTGAWTEVGVKPSDSSETEFKTYRYQRGLTGWLYKRHYYVNEKLKTIWVYQAEGFPGRPAHLVANKDLITMKALYGFIDINEIQKIQQEVAEERLNKLLKCQSQGELLIKF